MGKKTNDNTIELIYLNEQDDNKKKKTKSKSKKLHKQVPDRDDIINLDNEVIIGLTPKNQQKQTKKPPMPKKQPTKPTNSKNKKTKEIPKKRKIKVKILKWTSILILLIGAMILFMLSPAFNIKQINVTGNSKISSEEIISLSQINIDENTFKIRTSEVIEKIKTNTYVEDVIITRELPSAINIEIKERVPQTIIQIANGNAYIDAKGYILEISTEMLNLPILKGYNTPIDSIVDFENTKKLSDEDCSKMEVVNQIIEAANNNGILTYITSIDISDSDNINLNLDSEKKVAHFGNASDANLRVLYLKRMIEEESGKEGEAFIDWDSYTSKPKPFFREKV